jgi:DNA-directed RNA polymerase sigma subunit (sigma70/sigma32)
VRRIAEKPLAQYHPQVGDLWRSRHHEPESEKFDSLPDWMITDPIPQEDLADVGRIIAEYMTEALTNREMLMIRMRFWGDLTLEESGIKMGVTRERARQIEMKALRKLRHPVIRAKLREYSLWSDWFDWIGRKGSAHEKRKALIWPRAEYPTNQYGYTIHL